MAKTTDTKTTKNVGNKNGETAEGNTSENAAPGGPGPGSSQVQEWIETGPGQVQSTKPVNEPA